MQHVRVIGVSILTEALLNPRLVLSYESFNICTMYYLECIEYNGNNQKLELSY